MTRDEQISKLIDEQCDLIAFLRSSWRTMERTYRREILAAIDDLILQEKNLKEARYEERRKAWTMEGLCT